MKHCVWGWWTYPQSRALQILVLCEDRGNIFGIGKLEESHALDGHLGGGQVTLVDWCWGL